VKGRQLPVFVYGTLRRDEKNYSEYLAGRTIREEPATAEGRLFYVSDGGYPYLEPGPGAVAGELVHLDPKFYEETLQRLDELEEYNPADEANSVYLRREADVALAGGSRVTAWIYYWNSPQTVGTPLTSGDFRRRFD